VKWRFAVPVTVMCDFQDILFADDDEQTALPDAAEKFEELLTRWHGFVIL